MSKINCKDDEACLRSTCKDMQEMTLKDAIHILPQPVEKFHAAKSEAERINLPRPRLIRAYEVVLEERQLLGN